MGPDRKGKEIMQKRAYKMPRLTAYGSVASLTQVPSGDGGGGGGAPLIDVEVGGMPPIDVMVNL
jgi:hypothetical protein